MPFNLFAYMNKIGLSIRPILLPFIARRGQPRRIRSDNGSNFVRGERELREAIQGWNQEKIYEFLLAKSIEWVFNPPARRLGKVYPDNP